MDTAKHINEKITRLYSNQFLGSQEIVELEKWLAQAQSDPDVERWLAAHWDNAENAEAEISLEGIRIRIIQSKQKIKAQQMRRLMINLQKIAAVLVVPLIVLSVWLMTRQPGGEKMVLMTAKGEHSHVVLPDGSEVWLNVDTKLEYATDFNQNNRLLNLTGEALFKVAKGKRHPFVVEASDFKVTAIGTEFNISAYDGEPVASTYLKEGVVKFDYTPGKGDKRSLIMNPGEQATVAHADGSLHVRAVSGNNSDSWVRGELVFNNEPIDRVFRKVERWYNVKISYSFDDFANETLTVNLKNGESLARLLEIMDQAIGIQVKQNNNEYVITRK
jgi:ferric-dicitrate binding protein FerR (iron transport regulator)